MVTTPYISQGGSHGLVSVIVSSQGIEMSVDVVIAKHTNLCSISSPVALNSYPIQILGSSPVRKLENVPHTA